MVRTLRAFVAAERKKLGMTQTELANRSGVPRTTVNRVEKGITQLPNADVRRALAKALGRSHVDLLVAAGELEPEELKAAGLEGVVAEGPERFLIEMVNRYRWTEEQAVHMAGIIRAFREFDASYLERREPAPLSDDPYYRQGPPPDDD